VLVFTSRNERGDVRDYDEKIREIGGDLGVVKMPKIRRVFLRRSDKTYLKLTTTV
jgi:hypothetical protein